MVTRPRRRRSAVRALLVSSILLAAVAGPVGAQTAAECTQATTGTPEQFGPTDVSAVTGNRRLSIGLNDRGTVTAMKWPSPSYYDQIKYRTTDREQEHMGALPNEGAFVGLAWRSSDKQDWDFAWLRDWDTTQRYRSPDGDEIVTTYDDPHSALSATVRDVVAPTRDALVRHVVVSRPGASQPVTARLFSFVNFNPVSSKNAQAPYRDWCQEERNDDGASYDKGHDVITATKSDDDESTGRASSVGVAMGFGGKSSGVQVGEDSYASGGAGTSAYDDAADGELSGVTVAAGQSDAALSLDLNLTSAGDASADIIVTAGTDAKTATASVESIRQSGFQQVRNGKQEWWDRWLRNARLPKGSPSSVTTLVKRALVSIRQAADVDGLVVASITTQPPYGLDWIRNGAYVNRALELAGHPETVESHNEQYAALQATAAFQPTGGGATPSGNWAQNYYADGVVGGPVPYAVDETGLGIFTLWDHYAVTHDRGYLLRVYEAIQRGAQYLTDVCRDPSSGLQCVAPEDDDPNPQQTIRGAAAVWLGLDSAAKAAAAKARLEKQGSDVAKSNAKRWSDRRDELLDAMQARYFDGTCGCYPAPAGIGGEILWPVHLFDYSSKLARSQADANYTEVADAIAGKVDRGGAESQELLGNAYVWRKGADLKKLQKALTWVATTPTTNQTRILGEAWMNFPDADGPVTTMSGQPYVPSLSMFYLAALKAWGTTRWTR